MGDDTVRIAGTSTEALEKGPINTDKISLVKIILRFSHAFPSPPSANECHG